MTNGRRVWGPTDDANVDKYKSTNRFLRTDIQSNTFEYPDQTGKIPIVLVGFTPPFDI